MSDKILISILILLISASSCVGLFYPKKIQAAEPVIDMAQIGQWVKSIALQVKDLAIQAKDFVITAARWAWEQKNSALKVALAKFRKVLLDNMVNQIVQWIQGGGKPKFVSDWRSFLKNTADIAGGQALEELLGKDVMKSLCQPNWAIRLNIGLRGFKPYRTRVMCTLSDIGVNFGKFMTNFRSGGWEGWIKMNESQNNPYGLYLAALDEKLIRESEAVEAAKNEVMTGAGFLSDKICKKMNCVGGEIITGSFKPNEVDPNNCYCEAWETRTPGKMLADTLGFSIRKDMEWLITNEDWESYVVAITDALINRLLKDGVMALTSSDVSGTGSSFSDQTGLLDQTPPITEASTIDPWHIQITSNEDAFIYYTTDGTNPKTDNSGSASSQIYSSPIEIKVPTTLKWFGIDNFSNYELAHTLYLSPPFPVEQTEPSSVAFAVSKKEIALVANTAAAIHYTIDGSTPTTNSPYYVKKLDISNAEIFGPIRWFAESPQGVPEGTIHELATFPPFPNDDFPKIADFVAPAANFTTIAAAPIGVFFALNPSNSKDNDSTPKIIMYEWDFDNDGMYDWWSLDYDRDGIFEENKCRNETPLCAPSYDPLLGSYFSIGNGFAQMNIPANAAPGTIEVMYTTSGQKTIGLRVTDDEGLYSSKTVDIIIP